MIYSRKLIEEQSEEKWIFRVDLLRVTSEDYTIPQLFSMAPSTRFTATTPLSGYSDIDTISWIYLNATTRYQRQHINNREYESYIKHSNQTYVRMVRLIYSTDSLRPEHENYGSIVWYFVCQSSRAVKCTQM